MKSEKLIKEMMDQYKFDIEADEAYMNPEEKVKLEFHKIKNLQIKHSRLIALMDKINKYNEKGMPCPQKITKEANKLYKQLKSGCVYIGRLVDQIEEGVK